MRRNTLVLTLICLLTLGFSSASHAGDVINAGLDPADPKGMDPADPKGTAPIATRGMDPADPKSRLPAYAADLSELFGYLWSFFAAQQPR